MVICQTSSSLIQNLVKFMWGVSPLPSLTQKWACRSSVLTSSTSLRGAWACVLNNTEPSSLCPELSNWTKLSLTRSLTVSYSMAAWWPLTINPLLSSAMATTTCPFSLASTCLSSILASVRSSLLWLKSPRARCSTSSMKMKASNKQLAVSTSDPTRSRRSLPSCPSSTRDGKYLWC